MKVRIDIDCTPAEARSFLGLPDTEALQQEMLEKLREQFLKQLDYKLAEIAANRLRHELGSQ